MTQVEKDAIIAEYKDKSVKTKDICKKFHITHATMTKILDEGGVPHRRKKPTPIRKCPKCKCYIVLEGAKFCPFCGETIMTTREIAVEKLRSLFSRFTFLPETQAEEARQIVKDVIEFIEKEGDK